MQFRSCYLGLSRCLQTSADTGRMIGHVQAVLLLAVQSSAIQLIRATALRSSSRMYAMEQPELFTYSCINITCALDAFMIPAYIELA